MIAPELPNSKKLPELPYLVLRPPEKPYEKPQNTTKQGIPHKTILDINALVSQTDQRRAELLLYKTARIPMKAIIAELAAKYGVKPGTIYDDWESREKWAGKFLDIHNSKKLLIDLVAFTQYLQKHVVLAISAADNSNARVGGIRAGIEVVQAIQGLLAIGAKNAMQQELSPSKQLVQLLRERFKDDSDAIRTEIEDKASKRLH